MPWAGSLLILLGLWSFAARAESRSTSELARDPSWRLLGFYEHAAFGGVRSAVIDPGFFLAPDGATNPLSELTATLGALERRDHDIICAHPARMRWLAGQTGHTEDPAANCGELREWKEKLDVGGLSLVMPASSLESALSAFSHTFLKIQSRHLAKTSTLHSTIGFSAVFDPETPFSELAVNGIFGGYTGRLDVHGYYEEIQQYGNAQSRDIFEYSLGLTNQEIDRLLDLVWEARSSGIRYYFLTRNCSYYVLALLDFARPTLHLHERFQGLVLPQETLLEVFWKTDLVTGMNIVPSKATKYRRLKENLRGPENVVYQDLVARPEDFERIWKSESQALDSEAKTRTLEAFSAFLLNTNPESEARSRALLARAQLGPSAAPTELPPISTPPHLGHESSTLAAGFGVEEGERYAMLRYRLVLHDLLNRAVGYNPDAQIEALSLEVMTKNRDLELRQFKLFDALSLQPLQREIKKTSWLIQSLIERRWTGADFRDVFLNDVGWGFSLEAHSMTFFALLTLNSELESSLEKGYQLGPGALFGIRVAFGESTTFLADLWAKDFILGQAESMVDSDVGLSHAFGRDWETRVVSRVRNHVLDTQLSFSHFF